MVIKLGTKITKNDAEKRRLKINHLLYADKYFDNPQV